VSVEPTRGTTKRAPPLPKFKPIKLSEVLRTATGKSTQTISSDATLEIIRRIDEQQADLLRALGLNPENPDWSDAFAQLAYIHHGVGAIHVDKARPPNKHAAKWTREQDCALLAAIDARLESGMTATAALNEMATDDAIWKQFPHTENSRSDNSPVSRRAQNYRKRLALIKKRDLLENIQDNIVESLVDGRLGLGGSMKRNLQKRRLDDSLGKTKSRKF
jgi:hypothetical protein